MRHGLGTVWVIASMGLASPALAGQASPALAAQALPPADGLDLAAAGAYVDEAGSSGNFQGAVLIGRGGEVVWQGAYGFADADLGVPLRTDHVFRLGSLTKPITASAVMVAVHAGRLALDDPACAALPTCPTAWRPVRLHHLLTHTSGISDRFGDLDAVPVERTMAELRRVLEGLEPGEPLESEPGAEYSYSNFNYVLIGAMLESAYGRPWEEVLDALVFEPLGLETLRYDDVFAVVPGRVRGYRREADSGLRNIEYDDHAAYAAGGLLSSAPDLFRWSRAVLEGELFGDDLLERSLTPPLGDYGFGWQVRRFFDRPVYNHTGGIDGFSTHLAHYPEQDVTVVVLTNVENDPAILRACDLAGLLFGWHRPSDLADPERTGRQRCGLER